MGLRAEALLPTSGRRRGGRWTCVPCPPTLALPHQGGGYIYNALRTKKEPIRRITERLFWTYVECMGVTFANLTGLN